MVDWITEPVIFFTFFIGEIVLIPYYAVGGVYCRAETRMDQFYRKN